ncbi:hypothetical protein MNEG_12511 [Monoraphidium neglectum]|uniref:PsbP C-terminal domain-containing protein n=1 Tax=Monoraphidium neglectum TaxID=145388 RepID=A0A0D2J6I9_9CHLO|nr:hypothetical protein MNEG_12511 [Monoraphidium neglectum]KIY95452.1 hypothetical protein MNEG_12511 [Monoraphidium neglectum]|eukprot:XP_013894472.1 hypothetical protein MNEG_12511 [Monoraphidium neglectum]
MVVGSDDATTIINSVLSGYGLPTLKASAGYKVWDEFADEYTFETADKIAVEVLGIPEDGDLATAAVTAAVLPGGGRLTQDDLLTLPPKSDVKVTSLTLDGQEYTYLEFPSETITRSGYQIRRQNFAVAAVKRGKLYTIAASARGDQYSEAKRQLLQHVVESFRVR